MRAWLFVLLMCGCAAAGDLQPTAPAELALVSTATAVEVVPRCEVVFSPEADIADLVEGAAAQWSEATGCDVHLGEGGIPVHFVDSILNPQGESQCGVTHRVRTEAGEIIGAADIEISTATRCRLTARDVLHEMGHGLAPHRGHTLEGLMTVAPSGVDYVDDVARRSICTELGC